MKKIGLIFMILLIASCGASTSKSSLSNSLYEVLTQEEDGGASIRFFEILSEENEITMLINDVKLIGKIKPNDIQTSNFIILNMGEKSAKGNKIGIESVIETDKNIIITVKESAPKSGSITSQEITTPYSIVKINSKKEIIIM